MMAALFSCTKCHKRFPFEDLSKGEQHCKECRNKYPVAKCTYCRAEFRQMLKGITSSVCGKCAQNLKYFGKPSPCGYCSIQAAFIGNRCQRCVNSEKKWGPPQMCEQCKLKCAFDRPEQTKLEGKLMCWLCDQAYKRVLAKTRKAQDTVLKSSHSSSSLTLKTSHSSSSLGDTGSKSNTPTQKGQNCLSSQPSLPPSASPPEAMTVLERLTKMAELDSSPSTPPLFEDIFSNLDDENKLAKPKIFHDKTETEAVKIKEEQCTQNKFQHQRHKHHHGHSQGKRHQRNDEVTEIKKPKPEKSSFSEVLASISALDNTSDSVLDAAMDATASENGILIAQLKEQIESLRKQMASVDQQLLEKDKMITELKAKMYEKDKVCRTKVNALQQSHASAIENVQIKNRQLLKQVSFLAKSKKSTDSSFLSFLET